MIPSINRLRDSIFERREVLRVARVPQARKLSLREALIFVHNILGNRYIVNRTCAKPRNHYVGDVVEAARPPGADVDGNQDASPKGDGPGFVAVEDACTLLIPERKGNRLMFSLRNILANPQVWMIFLIPGTDETFRVNGTAELSCDPDLLVRLSARGAPALLAIRVTVKECFFHCAKAFIRSQLWKPETWAERHKISFGKMLSAKVGGGEELARQVDQAIEQDYKHNL